MSVLTRVSQTINECQINKSKSREYKVRHIRKRKKKKLIKAFHFHSPSCPFLPLPPELRNFETQPGKRRRRLPTPPPAPWNSRKSQKLPSRRRALAGARAPGGGGGALLSAGAGDGQLAGVLGLRRAARLGGARRGRHRGADAAGAQPRARALLHLRRPQHSATLRRRQGPSRRTRESFRVFQGSPASISGQQLLSPCRLSRCCWRKALTLTPATTAAR